ncbi:MAG TPA: hypothetical protein VFC39_03815, partial [Acidobacteriaceae bacterium]|nr:hypothetical protein [Acidobacteriaceae bacterium]
MTNKGGVCTTADEGGYGGSDLDALAVLGGGEGAGVGFAVGRGFAGAVLVAVEVVDVDGLELAQIPGAHGDVREAVEPGVVGDEAEQA